MIRFALVLLAVMVCGDCFAQSFGNPFNPFNFIGNNTVWNGVSPYSMKNQNKREKSDDAGKDPQPIKDTEDKEAVKETEAHPTEIKVQSQ